MKISEKAFAPFLLSLSIFSFAGNAQADEAAAGAQAMWCFSGVVLSKTALTVITHQSGKALSGPAEAAVLVASCGGGIAAVRSMADAYRSEIPAQEQLNQKDSENNEE